MRKLLFGIFISSVLTATAQVPKQVIVEHFTNSECSICASKNPGFYSNLNAQENFLHLAIHPSSPYPSCELNQNNVAENDGRTNYYGIYGGTPRLVIQGTVISSGANYASPDLFIPFLAETSPAIIRIKQYRFNDEIFQSEITIKAAVDNNLGEIKLFAALAEDTVFYSGGNGEDEHFDVFRKALTDVVGNSIVMPAFAGDSIVVITTANLDASWDSDRLYTIAILQSATDKLVIQSAEERVVTDTIGTVAIADFNNPLTPLVYLNPNPVSQSAITFTTNSLEPGIIRIFDSFGRLVLEDNYSGSYTAHLPNLGSGKYIATLTNANGFAKCIFIKL